MELTVQLRKRVRGLVADELESFMARARKAVGLKGGASLVVTSNAEIRRMNRWFRGKDKITDVLSFGAEGIAGYAGDIAVSLDIAAENARRFGHSVGDEVRILALHGLLHLAGYDHETDRGRMARREKQLRAALGLPASLIQRAQEKARRKTNGRKKPRVLKAKARKRKVR
ncbi:MAG: rRNA maturation RNase YbeY [Acidobacteriales bacterium]|nr:rRNA maturation RNase YbeY [Terriglobales bacterium]